MTMLGPYELGTNSTPENGIYYFYLGEEYSLLFEWEKAINYYENGVMKDNLPSFNRALLHQNLADLRV